MKIQQNKGTADVQQKGMGYFNVCRENYYRVWQLSSEVIKKIITPSQALWMNPAAMCIKADGINSNWIMLTQKTVICFI